MGIFAKPVLFLGLADGTILNGFRGAVGNAGHTVGAVIAPDRLPILHGYVIQRANPLAFAASYTAIGCVKIFGLIAEF